MRLRVVLPLLRGDPIVFSIIVHIFVPGQDEVRQVEQYFDDIISDIVEQEFLRI